MCKPPTGKVMYDEKVIKVPRPTKSVPDIKLKPCTNNNEK